MNNNRKIYFHIDNGTSMDEILALLDRVILQSDNKDEIDKLINDSDMEFIAPEEAKPTDNPNNASVLTPERNVHVVDEGTTHTKEQNNTKQDKTDKRYRIIPMINYLNESFSAVFPNEPEQSIDENTTLLNEAILENQTYKMGFKWWFRCASSTDYLCEFDLYLGQKKDVEVNLGESVMMQLSDNFLTA